MTRRHTQNKGTQQDDSQQGGSLDHLTPHTSFVAFRQASTMSTAATTVFAHTGTFTMQAEGISFQEARGGEATLSGGSSHCPCRPGQLLLPHQDPLCLGSLRPAPYTHIQPRNNPQY